MAISYLDFIIENEKFKNQTAIIAVKEIETKEFENYLFLLRQLNIRVILLFTNENEDKEKIKIALRLGIYDLVFGNFYPSEIKELLDNPKTFNDVSKRYKKLDELKIRKRKLK